MVRRRRVRAAYPRMLRRVTAPLLTVAITVAALFLLAIPAGAVDTSLPVTASTSPSDTLGAVGQGIEEEYRTFTEEIPEEVARHLPEEFFPAEEGEGSRTDFVRVAEGVAKASSAAYLLGTVGEILSVEWGVAWRVLARTVGLMLISAVVGTIRRSVRSEAAARAVSLGVSCAVLASLVSTLYEQLEKVSLFLSRLNALINALLPMMATLYVMGGNVAVAAVQNSTLLLFMSLCENLCNRTVIPMTGLCLAFTLASIVSPSLSLRGLSGWIKSSYTKTLGFVMLLLAFVLSAQTALRAAADSLGARAAKFLAGNLIPVVGGALGDTFRTVAAGVSFLKSTVGVGAVTVLLLLLLPVLISLMLTRLALRLSLAVAELLGCEAEGRLLGELIGIYGTLIAVVALCTVLFIFALTLFVRVSAA